MNELVEVVKIVDDLNCQLYDELCHDKPFADITDQIHISLTTNGYCSEIEFLGIQIWNSENDERVYDENNDKYEPLDLFLKKQICKCARTIGSIML